MDTAGGAQAGRALGGQIAGAQPIEAPRTLASAASRLDGLNGRLSKAIEQLAMISQQIGAMTPVAGKGGNTETAPMGAVHRLNDAADDAHAQITEIENLIGGISRALG